MSVEEEWFVHSEDGTDYSVGVWADGVYTPGTREDALREVALLRTLSEAGYWEPTAYAWGRSRRVLPKRRPLHPFRCERCGGTFWDDSTEDERDAECESLFGFAPEPEDRASICDVCHEQMMVWAERNGLLV